MLIVVVILMSSVVVGDVISDGCTGLACVLSRGNKNAFAVLVKFDSD